MTYFPTTQIYSADSPSIDAFSRMRVSNPEGVFDAQLTYDLHPLLYEQSTNGTGAAVSHDSTERAALMTFASTPTGGIALMQSYEHFRYQPGKSQQIFITFNMVAGVADVVKFAGYSDGSNGFEFIMDGTTPKVRLLSDTSIGDQTITQASWNLDQMNGTGPSGVTFDASKTQILVIDFQALYVGRVRIGFDIGGLVVYVHEFLHSNVVTNPYIQTANLPIRVGMTCTGTVSTTMNFVCSSVISEGGHDETSGYSFAVEGTVTASSGSQTHILSLRPKTTFNFITNRAKFELEGLDLLVTGNYPVKWDLVAGQAISGTTTFNEANASYSAFEYNTAGTISGSPAIIMASGFVPSSNQAKGSVSRGLINRYPITLNIAGAVRALGTLSVLVTGIGGSSACNVCVNWREIR